MSNEAKFTPGPYEVDSGANKRDGIYIVAPRWYLARMCKEVESTEGMDDTEANAHLFAASWDLYEALKAVEWLDSDRWCPSCHQHRPNGHAVDCKLDAALRKARGEV